MNRAVKRQQKKLARKTAKQKGSRRQPATDVPAGFLSDLIQKGVQAHRAGRLDEADSFYRKVLDIHADHDEANYLTGLIALGGGRIERAVKLIKRAIRANPGKAAYHANLAPALQRQGRLDDAAASCHTALSLDPNYAEAHANLADVLQQQGKLDEAESSYRKALTIDPSFAEAYNNLGNVLKEQGLMDEAVASYRQALANNPNDAEAHYNIGYALQEQGQLEDAAASYRKALAINENFVLVHYHLGNLYEKTNQLEKAELHIRKVLAVIPDHPGANVSLAVLLRRRGESRAAIEGLKSLTSGKLQGADAYRVHFELGKLYDLELDSERAFMHFTLANKAQAREAGHKAGVQAAEYRLFVENTARILSADFVNSWAPLKLAPADDPPVFLVGFPRSGTTLLDQILDGHEQLQVMEENPAMAAVRASVEEMPGGYPAALADLSETDVQTLREMYLRNVEQFLERQPGTILIDKLPLNICNIPLIMRLFPDARFILALRHPLDVVLSNFMQFFQLNDAMSNFLSVEGVATLYRLIMNFWLQCAEVMALNFHITKYEDLVADMESEARGLLEYLDVKWDNKVLDYRAHARKRGIINTPSYAQVTEPIYQRAAFRWTRYEQQLNPIIEDMHPLAETFGYTCT